ncbi:NarK/NasA family nitrate transporter [Pseudomonas aeruginosa]|nr:NarK/NasA family nitrate transporter [Pseudomonas aeruginosa]
MLCRLCFWWRAISRVIYLFSPAIMDWWIDPNGAWYRPYLLWLILIVVTFILQSQRDADEL